jgi:hypothetical protein
MSGGNLEKLEKKLEQEEDSTGFEHRTKPYSPNVEATTHYISTKATLFTGVFKLL